MDSTLAPLIIPFASSLDDACQAAIKTLTLPHLTQFLEEADLVSQDSGDEFDFIPPHERVLQTSVHAEHVEAPIIVTPCHWSVGIDNIRMDNPGDLQLSDSESRALFAAVTSYFESDGIALAYDSPLRWLVKQPIAGEAIHHMALQETSLASLDRVIGRNVDVWQPQTQGSRTIRRLQNEVQMLLFTHPINEARESKGLPTINSFWLSRLALVNENVDFSLRDAALRGDWQAWLDAWQALDSKALKHVNQVTLCGERHAHTYAIPTNRSLGNTIKRLFKPSPSIQSVLSAL